MKISSALACAAAILFSSSAATAQQVQYRAIDLTNPDAPHRPQRGAALDISAQGDLCGYLRGPFEGTYLWRADGGVEAIPLTPEPSRLIRTEGISPNGRWVVAGTGRTGGLLGMPVIFDTSVDGFAPRFPLLEDGLADVSATFSDANNAGVAVGMVDAVGGASYRQLLVAVPGEPVRIRTPAHASATTQDVGTETLAVSEAGIVVGSFGGFNNTDSGEWFIYPFVYDIARDEFIDLPLASHISGRPDESANVRALDINDQGVIVGYAASDFSGSSVTIYPLVWRPDPDTGAYSVSLAFDSILLADGTSIPSSRFCAQVHAINNQGWMVGSVWFDFDADGRPDTFPGGFLFKDGQAFYLDTRTLPIPEPTTFLVPLYDLFAINDRGWIAGRISDTDLPGWPVLLVPWSVCAADITDDGQVQDDDIAAFVDAFLDKLTWNADLDTDGDEDVDDINAFIDAYLDGC